MKSKQAFRRLLSRLLTDPRITDDRWLAYILATVKHETAATWEPITERGGPEWFKRYEGRADLGNTSPGDGIKYPGRGFSMITGKFNYAKFGRLLGIPLVEKPELACEFDHAYEILVRGMIDGHFTGAGLKRYYSETVTDHLGARAIINGTDKAQLIAGYAQAFEALIRQIGQAA